MSLFKYSKIYPLNINYENINANIDKYYSFYKMLPLLLKMYLNLKDNKKIDHNLGNLANCEINFNSFYKNVSNYEYSFIKSKDGSDYLLHYIENNNAGLFKFVINLKFLNHNYNISKNELEMIFMDIFMYKETITNVINSTNFEHFSNYNKNKIPQHHYKILKDIFIEYTIN